MTRFTILLLAASISVTANAQSLPTRSVSYADLDLTQETGVKTLKHRVARAVESLCGSYATAHAMEDIDRIADCRRQAESHAAPQIVAAIGRSGTLHSAFDIAIPTK